MLNRWDLARVFPTGVGVIPVHDFGRQGVGSVPRGCGGDS